MIQAVIFNLDGVIAASHECQYNAWKQLAQEQGIAFSTSTYRQMAGMKRMDSLRILLKRAERSYSPGEMWALSARKIDLFSECLSRLGPEAVLPGAGETVAALRQMGIRTAVASCSENAPGILKQLKIDAWFDAVIDGGQISAGKPDPEAFFLAARKLAVPAGNCLVIENTQTGIAAAQAAGMKVIALREEEAPERDCPLQYQSLKELALPELLQTGSAEALMSFGDA